MAFKEALLVFLLFLWQVAVTLGAYCDNITPRNSVVFFVLIVMTLASFILAAHWKQTVRNRRMVKILSVVSVIWSVSGPLFFQDNLSKLITSGYFALCLVSLAIYILFNHSYFSTTHPAAVICRGMRF